jgi:hypothetical protein
MGSRIPAVKKTRHRLDEGESNGGGGARCSGPSILRRGQQVFVRHDRVRQRIVLLMNRLDDDVDHHYHRCEQGVAENVEAIGEVAAPGKEADHEMADHAAAAREHVDQRDRRRGLVAWHLAQHPGPPRPAGRIQSGARNAEHDHRERQAAVHIVLGEQRDTRDHQRQRDEPAARDVRRPIREP